jgi:diguanylate cyclase (GGDEF)-like protein
MNLLIRPVYQLLNQLSYQGKFLLMASFLAFPLLFLSAQLAFNFHTNANQAQQIRSKLNDIRQATELIQELETLRDTSVIHFLTRNTSFTKKYDLALSSIIDSIDAFDLGSLPEQHRYFLKQLKGDLEAQTIFPGNEGASVSVIFQNANNLVDQAYFWRMKLSYEYVSEENAEVRQILEMISNNYYYFHALGEARAVGTYHLNIGFLDSFGIQTLDNTYKALTNSLKTIELSKQQYQAVSERFPDLTQTLKLSQVNAVRTLLDEQLIQAIDLDYPALEFYENTTSAISVLQKENQLYLDMADTLLQEREDYFNTQLVEFYTFAAIGSLLLVYLFVGLYIHMHHNVRKLVEYAKRVAKGEYERPIEFDSKDELLELALAMDEMRAKLKSREEQLRIHGQTDGLTQLKNRAYFDEAYPLAIAQAGRSQLPVCCIMLDVDHFKAVNDNHGHQVGDACLQYVAESFRQHFKRKTDIVARYGGEEYIAVIVGESPNAIYDQTETFREKLASHDLVEGDLSLSITASFGLASSDGTQEITAAELLSLCDSALYEAKRAGRNQVIWRSVENKPKAINE